MGEQSEGKDSVHLTAPVPSEVLLSAPSNTEARFRDALVWALGAHDDSFRERYAGDPPYWWRTELQGRAGLEWDGEKFIDNPTFGAQAKAARAQGIARREAEGWSVADRVTLWPGTLIHVRGMPFTLAEVTVALGKASNLALTEHATMPSSFINAADISASDMPHTVVRKLDEAATRVRQAHAKTESPIRSAALEEAADHISTGEYCRYVDHETGTCDCREMAAAIRALAATGEAA